MNGPEILPDSRLGDVTPVVAEAPAEVAPALETKRTAEDMAARIIADAQAEATKIVAEAAALAAELG